MILLLYDVLAMYVHALIGLLYEASTCSMVISLTADIIYLLCSNFVVKKRHEQVLEMKKME